MTEAAAEPADVVGDNRDVMGLEEVDRTLVDLVGGKGAHLGELSRMDGVHVPPGFCVTSNAFRRIVGPDRALADQLDRLSDLHADDRESIAALSAQIRETLQAIAIPETLTSAIIDAVAKLGDPACCAVRSSAIAEDLPTASFAGQQDTYLNVIGPEAILRHISRCWASLFTERAVTYRLQNGFHHSTVQMAVVVQRMVFPRAAGILFTADPVTSNRRISAVEAAFGLGEAVVSGLVNPDAYTVRDGVLVGKGIAAKHRAVHAAPSGGTHVVDLDPSRQRQPALTDGQVLRLVELGGRIERQFGEPQDIEWCLVDDEFQIVQSRPITTLFPVPAVDDRDNHVYLSVGHQQMMTDPMKPLGISIWQHTALAPMHTAGGRLFVDVTGALGSPSSRAGLLDVTGRSDPLIRDALQTVLDRGDVVPELPDTDSASMPHGSRPATIATDPAVVSDLVERDQSAIAALKLAIRTRSGPALFEFLLEAFGEHKRALADPVSMQVIMAGMQATWWLKEQLPAWLADPDAADTLARSAPHNVTSEMGLALMDVADVIRPYPEVVAFLRTVEDGDFLEELVALPGGRQAREAIGSYLDRYGMRCVGEIDITRPRWSEQPAALVPAIIGNVDNFEPDAGRRRFHLGRLVASAKEEEVLERLRALPDGERKAEETKRMIDRVRTFIGYREYPKYGLVCRYFVYKQALTAEAERLVRDHVLAQRDDVFYLTFEEFHDAVYTHRVDADLIRRRKDEFASYIAMTPPRVLTSDGEALNGRYCRSDLPTGALAGLPVSAGIVEGRARVIPDIAAATLEAGDILVTTYTDPSWTPLFPAIDALVTEVGGLMTHGAVIAREYGLPAVVGVADATRLIPDGQRIRVNGTDGYIEILPPA